jgi:hypothetical protein
LNPNIPPSQSQPKQGEFKAMAKNRDDNKTMGGPANRDPITGAPGAHPVGVGAGSAGAGTAGAVIGGVVGGPIGAVVGAAIGAVAGGLGGKAAAETVNPTVEDAYWRDNYNKRPYAAKDKTYDHYQPAYKYGWESRMMHGGKQWTDVESDLERKWSSSRGNSQLGWNDARPAARDAWDRLDGRNLDEDKKIH